MSQNPAQTDNATGQRAPLLVLPVFGNLAVAERAVRSLDESTPRNVPLLVVDDVGPERITESWLRARISSGRPWDLLRHRHNLGFVETCNEAMSNRGGRDVVLVNSDVIVFDGWLAPMRLAAKDPTVASVTALSNVGSVATSQLAAKMTTPDRVGRLAAQRCSVPGTHELPVAVGHCVLLTDQSLTDVGLFDPVFSPGYGEEVDWSIRARRRGWRHVAAAGCVVWHEGAASFPSRGLRLRRRRAELRLLRRYPREFLGLRTQRFFIA